MSTHQPGDQLSAGYEVLRAQSVGERPPDSPRGLALILTQGLPAWIGAWGLPTASLTAVRPGATTAPGASSTEVVRLLTEMALGARTTVAIA